MGEGLAGIVINHVLTDCELSWEYLPLIKELKKMTEEDPLPDQSCLSSAEVRAGEGSSVGDLGDEGAILGALGEALVHSISS